MIPMDAKKRLRKAATLMMQAEHQLKLYLSLQKNDKNVISAKGHLMIAYNRFGLKAALVANRTAKVNANVKQAHLVEMNKIRQRMRDLWESTQEAKSST